MTVYELKIAELIPTAHEYACGIAGTPALYTKGGPKLDVHKWNLAYHSKMDELAHLAGIRRSINHSPETFNQGV